MKKRTLRVVNILRIIVLIGIVLYVISLFNNKPETETLLPKNNKIREYVDIDIPKEYLEIFKTTFKDSIKHIYTEIPKDSSTYPISSIRCYSQDITIMKFDSELSIYELLKIKNKKMKLTPRIWYTRRVKQNVEFDYSTNFSKKINDLNLYSSNKVDTVIFKDNLFIARGKLKTVCLNLKENSKINDFLFLKSSIFTKEYKLVIIKKDKSIFILFFAPHKGSIISEKKLYKLLR